MPSEAKPTKKTIGRYVRLTPEADKKLSDLRRRLSASRGEDLSMGDLIALALHSLDKENS